MAKVCSERTQTVSRIAPTAVIFRMSLVLSLTYDFTSNRLNVSTAESLKLLLLIKK